MALMSINSDHVSRHIVLHMYQGVSVEVRGQLLGASALISL